ncbi:unnamed protein product [Zymoseptoria tritici ST99CH_1A5]|uniref:Chromo domain-containing protein n=1 Tax=Zymoseptoria tritici ST99CH_1A5 TaxID=1276529 RepID=A0A1Y6M1W0_ZYMTR|nr:unnamed protein product [Zymoseptoria tritici ST99CH_1A5]
MLGILEHRQKTQYLVKWQDLGPSYNEWNDASELTECKDLVDRFEDVKDIRSHERQKKPTTKAILLKTYAPLERPGLKLKNPKSNTTVELPPVEDTAVNKVSEQLLEQLTSSSNFKAFSNEVNKYKPLTVEPPQLMPMQNSK